MAINFPLNLIDDLQDVGWSVEFNLLYRQEQSRHASGRTRVKDFGTPIWQATYITKNMSPNKLDFWRARLNALENGLQTFVAYPTSRAWPIKHPNGLAVSTDDWVLENGFWDDGGVWFDGIPWNGNLLTSGRVNSVNANNKALSIKEVSFLDLSIGDYISIEDKLYQVMEDVVGSTETGTTPQFEVRPHFTPNLVSVDDIVIIRKPFCLMTIVPNSINTSSGLNGRGSISFQAIESRG